MKHFSKLIKAGVCLIGLSVSFGVSAHRAMDPAHQTKVITAESGQVIPTNIHVEQTDGGVRVSGLLRKTRHSHLRIHGRVNVDLIGPGGAVLEHKSVQIRPYSISRARHNRWVRFSVLLPSTGTLNNNTIKVSYARYKTEKGGES